MHTISAAVRCPYCAHQMALSAETFAELRAYGAEVERRLAAANAELHRADAWNAWQREGRTPGKSIAVAMLLMGGVPMVLAAAAYGLFAVGLLDDPGPLLSFVIMGASYAGVIGYVVWYALGRQRRSGARAEASASRVACPNCGAPNALHAGQVLETCGHCGAALSPTHTVMMRGLDAAQEARRRAQMERYRAERTGFARATGFDMSRFVPFIAAGSLLPSMGCGTLMFTWQMVVTGEEPFHPAIFILWAMTAAVVGGMIGLVLYRRSKQNEWRRGLEDVARQFRGTVSHDTGQLVAWLNAYWAAPYEVRWLFKGVYFGAGFLDGCGYPVLINVEPNGYQRYYGPRLHVALAAWIPGISEGGQPPQPDARASELLAWLGRSGFDVDVTPGGLLARARRDVIARVSRDPSRCHELAPIVASLAEIAERVGARPVAPIQ